MIKLMTVKKKKEKKKELSGPVEEQRFTLRKKIDILVTGLERFNNLKCI